MNLKCISFSHKSISIYSSDDAMFAEENEGGKGDVDEDEES